MKEKASIKDIVVEWNGGKAGGFRSMGEAERFIKNVCRKTAPNLKYYIYKYI